MDQSENLEASQYFETNKSIMSLNAHFKRISCVLVAAEEVSKN